MAYACARVALCLWTLVCLSTRVAGFGPDPAGKPVITVQDGHLSHHGKRLVLNGANIAWINYGWDFNVTAATDYGIDSLCGMYDALELISHNGGNAFRLWLFEDAMTHETKTPFVVGNNGLVQGFAPGVVARIKEYLDIAHALGLVAILVLWNGAYVEADHFGCRIFEDSALHDSVIANLIKPMAAELAEHPALAMWEVINEPLGMVDFDIRSSASRCTDLDELQNKGRPDGGGWAGCKQPLTTVQGVINKQMAALKEASGGRQLITHSAWCPSPLSDTFGINLSTDECLVAAGGETTGTSDVAQVHEYAKRIDEFAPNPYGVGWPGATPASEYGLGMPIIVGEISNVFGDHDWQDHSIPKYNESMAMLATQVMKNDYDGLLTWEYTCIPPPEGNDDACIDKAAIVEGIRAAAAASPFARALPKKDPQPHRPQQCFARRLRAARSHLPSAFKGNPHGWGLAK